jgi:hypothetical protein
MTDPQQILIYQSEDGSTRIDVMLEVETLWLSQRQLTDLFGYSKQFKLESGREVIREVAHYNLDRMLALTKPPIFLNVVQPP